MSPSKFCSCFAWISDKQVNFGWPKITGVDTYQGLPCPRIEALFSRALSAPNDLSADKPESPFDEFTYGVRLSCREHIVVRFELLHDQPHALDIVAGMPPIAHRVKIADVETILLPVMDCGDRPRDFAG